MVDFICALRIEIAKRIIGERRKMNHRIEALQIGDRHVTEIFMYRRHMGQTTVEIATGKKIGIESRDLVLCLSNIGTRTAPMYPA